jgi:hypothetical protein
VGESATTDLLLNGTKLTRKDLYANDLRSAMPLACPVDAYVHRYQTETFSFRNYLAE